MYNSIEIGKIAHVNQVTQACKYLLNYRLKLERNVNVDGKSYLR